MQQAHRAFGRPLPTISEIKAFGLRKLSQTATAGLLLLGTGSAWAVDVTGVWWSPHHDAKLEIRHKEGTLHGRLIALLPKDADLNDIENPDPVQRERPLLGTEIMHGFVPDPDEKDHWIDGEIYDPESGYTYSCLLWPEGENRLKIRGYVGFSVFGRTETFTRVVGTEPAQHQNGEPLLVHVKATP